MEAKLWSDLASFWTSDVGHGVGHMLGVLLFVSLYYIAKLLEHAALVVHPLRELLLLVFLWSLLL